MNPCHIQNCNFNPDRPECQACKALQLLWNKQQQAKRQEAERRAANRREYKRLKNDTNYTDVKFDEASGGVKATHKNHKTHPNDNITYFHDNLTGDQLEKMFMDKAFALGHSVVFKAESDGITDLDMFLDGKLMDLVSVTVNSQHFRNQLNRKNGQLKEYNALHNEANQSVCMYFHDPTYYTYEKVELGIEKLKELTEVEIKTVYILPNDGSDIVKLDFP